jgi:hypothetical protein
MFLLLEYHDNKWRKMYTGNWIQRSVGKAAFYKEKAVFNNKLDLNLRK